MAYIEEDYFQLSGIQHFSFCRRQWALIHIENLWAENLRTVEGKLLHERAHDPFFSEKRGDVIITRDMPVFSRRLGVSGKCDVVEFIRDEEQGVPLAGRSSKWRPVPIEYKRGKPKIEDADRLQLCAQAVCLEEMLLCTPIAIAFLYYGETRHREPVDLTDDLRQSVQAAFIEMRQYYERGFTPRVKINKSCKACSLVDVCLPKATGHEQKVGGYIERMLAVQNQMD